MPVVVIRDADRLVLIDGYLRVEALRQLHRGTAIATTWPVTEVDALVHHRHLSALVHRRPKVWIRDVDQLHDLLDRYGDDALRAAFEIGLANGAIGAEYIHHYLTNTLGVVLGAVH